MDESDSINLNKRPIKALSEEHLCLFWMDG